MTGFKKPRLGQQLVYLQCRSLFVGDFTRMRRLEAIQHFLEQRRGAIPVLFDYPLEKVCVLAQKLLIDGIFASEALARQRFPWLFDPARLKPSEKAPSEAKASQAESSASWSMAATSQAAIEQAESGDESTGEPVTSDPPGQRTGELNTCEHNGRCSFLIAHESELAPRLPPPAPASLPYATQHRILNRLQAVLEECCFEFASNSLPELIVSHGLEVPEQVELPQWIGLLQEPANRLPGEMVGSVPAMGWEGLVGAAQKLQNMIARRVRLNTDGVIELFDDAILLTQMLKDAQRTAWCEGTRESLQSSLESIEGLGKALRVALSSQLQRIARKRAALDLLETKAISHMVELEQQKRASIYEAVNQAVLRPNVPTDKVRLISDGTEAVAVKTEGASHPTRNLTDKQGFGSATGNALPKDKVFHCDDTHAGRHEPGKVDQARDQTSNQLRSSISMPPKGSNPIPSLATTKYTPSSGPRTFPTPLAAGMKPNPPIEGWAEAKAASAVANLSASATAAPPGSRLWVSDVWERARLVKFDTPAAWQQPSSS